MTPGTIIALLILISIVALVIVKLAKDKKSGNICSGCSACSAYTCSGACVHSCTAPQNEPHKAGKSKTKD